MHLLNQLIYLKISPLKIAHNMPRKLWVELLVLVHWLDEPKTTRFHTQHYCLLDMNLLE